MDCDVIDDYSAQLQRWVLTATGLVAETPKLYVEQPYPHCNQHFAYRRGSEGASVRVRALRVSETGGKCLVCGAFWPPEKFEWLAKLLGCEPPPA